jgi:YspA, cpYpsA-related SLOG family
VLITQQNVTTLIVGEQVIMITVGIVGSRRRDSNEDFSLCCTALRKVIDQHGKDNVRIVSGGCPKGGDKFAETLARMHGLTIIIHHADWSGPAGRAAGFVRNSKIAQDCDILMAVVADDRTGGTEDTVKKAQRLKKTILLIPTSRQLEEVQ